MPRVSVVIVTHNRSHLLTKALDGLLEQTVSRELFEVLVIDNASTDDTSARVGPYLGPDSNVRYVFDSTPGSSAARNVGWRLAFSPIIAFLDDDAVPAPDWIERILHAFEDVTPRPACVGGRVEPAYEIPLPAWIHGSVLDHLTVVDHAPSPRFLIDVFHTQKLVSANMAIERSALEAIGGFNPHLGRVGTNLLSGEDVLIQLQVEALGRAIYYDPGIHVRHHVPAARLTAAWLSNRAYWGGVSDAMLVFLHRGATFWRAVRTCAWGIRWLLRRPTLLWVLMRGAEEDLERRCLAMHGVGFVAGGARAIRLSLSLEGRGPGQAGAADLRRSTAAPSAE